MSAASEPIVSMSLSATLSASLAVVPVVIVHGINWSVGELESAVT